MAPCLWLFLRTLYPPQKWAAGEVISAPRQAEWRGELAVDQGPGCLPQRGMGGNQGGYRGPGLRSPSPSRALWLSRLGKPSHNPMVLREAKLIKHGLELDEAVVHIVFAKVSERVGIAVRVVR